MQNQNDCERGMTRQEASVYITERWFKMSPKTLAKLAVVGGGPRFRKAGRTPIYTPQSCDKYAQSKITREVGSTAELRAAEAA